MNGHLNINRNTDTTCPHTRHTVAARTRKVPRLSIMLYNQPMDITDTLSDFMHRYEQANNSHVFENVRPFIAPDATYWFTDGSFTGIDQIQPAVQITFDTIQDETYTIENLHWIIEAPTVVACTYTFSWQGNVDGIPAKGDGRGTNILKRHDNTWQIIHEHLSS
jgi:ketosteroid isomerase-like protein